MVKHVVAFKLIGDDSVRREYACRFRDALVKLPEQIPFLRSIEVGVQENVGEIWDIVLTATLDSMADVQKYSEHPAHLAAVSVIRGVRDERACVDYHV